MPAPDSDEPKRVVAFDPAQRAEGIEWGLARLGIAAGGAGGRAGGGPIRILDVGGAPGLIAGWLAAGDSKRRFFIVDVYECHAERFAMASGAALPFGDGAFDAAISSDVLEHVAPGERPAFLKELARVASRGVVLGAPFARPAVDRAEELLNDFYRETLGEGHPWLREHRENGLPDLDDTAAALASAVGGGANRVARIASAPLEPWFLMQLAEIATQALPGAREPWRAFQEALTSLWLEPATERARQPALPYRWVLAAGPNVESEEAAGPSVDAPAAEVERCVARMEALVRLAGGIVHGARAAAWASESESGGGAAAAQRELIARLTAIVEQQERERAAGSAPTPEPPSGLRGVLRGLKRRATGRRGSPGKEQQP